MEIKTNWLVGYYIVEFEQHGEDRAKYGEKLLKTLAKRLNRRGFGERRLYEFRLTYIVYPQIGPVIANYIVKGTSINHPEGVRLLITRYKPKAQCRDTQTSVNCVPTGRDNGNK